MARLNISIPDELRERMEGLNVNWSSLAQAAFSHAVDLEQMKAQGLELEGGLERLRADRNRHGELEEASGFKAGVAWALEDASYDDLFAFVHDTGLRSDAAALGQRVEAVEDGFAFNLPDMPSRKSLSAAYARGFLAGAMDVFNKV